MRVGRFALPWLAALGLAVAGPAMAECKLNQLVELPVTMVGTAPVVTVGIDGHQARFMIDSGAFYSSMTPEAAKSFGLTPVMANGYLTGVGGEQSLQTTVVKTFNLAPNIPIPHVTFLVEPMAGFSVAGVLGENVLGLADVEYDLANGVVRILKPVGCSGKNLGYWASGAAAELTLEHTAKYTGSSQDLNRMVTARALLNDQKITLTFDTGAASSLLNLRAAARAGVTPQTPGVVNAGLSGGFGPHAINTWLAPFKSFGLGSEVIQNTTIRMGAMEGLNTDMLLGADFFLSHRVYVANSQGKMYLTYNGGPVFRFDRATLAAAAKAQAAEAKPEGEAQAGAPDPNTPTDADGFIRRASGFTARRDYRHALEDLTKAIDLDPKSAKAYVLRAQARFASRQPVLGVADLDEALKLEPANLDALLARGAAFAGQKDMARAKADFDAAAAIAPVSSMTRVQIANIYEAVGLFDQAIAQYDLWLAANARTPYAPEALNGRCWARAVLKTELDKALADCNAALKANPRTPSFLDSRALAHVDRGELDLAVADYTAALALETKPAPITLYARGVAKQKKGDKAGGDADIQQAVGLAPRVADQAKRYGIVADASPTAQAAGAAATATP